jgi:hypothetical protein
MILANRGLEMPSTNEKNNNGTSTLCTDVLRHIASFGDAKTAISLGLADKNTEKMIKQDHKLWISLLKQDIGPNPEKLIDKERKETPFEAYQRHKKILAEIPIVTQFVVIFETSEERSVKTFDLLKNNLEKYPGYHFSNLCGDESYWQNLEAEDFIDLATKFPAFKKPLNEGLKEKLAFDNRIFEQACQKVLAMDCQRIANRFVKPPSGHSNNSSSFFSGNGGNHGVEERPAAAPFPHDG